MDNTKDIKNNIVMWIKEYMRQNGGANTPIVIGLSGGKDSTICAALCKEAVGTSRVIGVIIPDIDSVNSNKDAQDAIEVANYLGIKYYIFPTSFQDFYNTFKVTTGTLASNIIRCNYPSRIRMATIYAVANQFGGRVCCTCNKSETYVGYDTLFGDQCGDFAPLQLFTATEVKEIGEALNLRPSFIYRPSDDGMCGMTDEERWGFSYALLDRHLDGEQIDDEIAMDIEHLHQLAKHKINRVKLPMFPYDKENSLPLFS